jgi:GntR family transcriptional regulator of arabinose operon
MSKMIAGSTFREAQRKMLAYVLSNNPGPNERLPSERELEQILGIGRQTLNKAIASLIAQGHLRREGYKLLTQAPEPTASPASAIQVLVPYAEVHRPPQVLHKLVEDAQDVAFGNHSLIVPMLARNDGEQRDQLTQLLRSGTNGFVIWLWPTTTPYTADLLRQFKDRHIPFVACDTGESDFHFVGTDNHAGGMLAVSHLHQCGHRQLAFLNPHAGVSSVAARAAGYQHACLELGLSASRRRLFHLQNYEKVEEFLRTFREENPSVTGLFCGNDMLALKVLEAAQTLGINVPDDLAVVGFDDIDACRHSNPPLTTIAQDFLELGTLAVQLLYRLMLHTRQMEHRPVYRIRLEPYLVARESTGPSST